jgi:hypothetical protein
VRVSSEGSRSKNGTKSSCSSVINAAVARHELLLRNYCSIGYAACAGTTRYLVKFTLMCSVLLVPVNLPLHCRLVAAEVAVHRSAEQQ